MTISPGRLDHAVLFSSELEPSVLCCTDTKAAFLQLPRSGNHENLGLFGVGGDGTSRRRGAIGLDHLLWQVDTIDDPADAQRVLLDSGACTGESSHGATRRFCGVDPDGDDVAIRWMLPGQECGINEHATPIDHLYLAAEVQQCSGVPTVGHLTAEPAAARS